MSDTDTQGSLDHAAYRQALGCFATGVTIITARNPTGDLAGVTANSFNSVSLDPPLVLWSLSLNSSSLLVFQEANHFAVNVLATDQTALSSRFAKSAETKFDGIEFSDGAGGAPLLDGVSARFECRNEFRYYGGDHVIFVGRVVRFAQWDRPPLVFCHGRYQQISPLPASMAAK